MKTKIFEMLGKLNLWYERKKSLVNKPLTVLNVMKLYCVVDHVWINYYVWLYQKIF